MTRAGITFLAPLLLLGTATYGTTASYAYDVSISTPDGVVRAGDHIPIDIIETNNSSQERSISFAMEQMNIKVWREDGSPVSFTKGGRYLHGQATTKDIEEDEDAPWSFNGDGRGVILPPGAQHEKTVTVNNIFDMTAPGNYLIRIQGTVPPVPPGLTVESNVIMVTVTN